MYEGVVSLSQVQLEKYDEGDDEAGTHLPQDPRDVLNDCQRYYELGSEENQIVGDGSQQCYGMTDNVAFKVTKVKKPVMCMYNAVTGGSNPPENVGVLHTDTRKFVATSNIRERASTHGYGKYTSSVSYDWVADSEFLVCMNNPTYINYSTTTTAAPSD